MNNQKKWDFIIVGAGSAGSVLADKLSVDPAISVLLIEEGPPSDGWMVKMPKGFGKLLFDPNRSSSAATIHDRGIPNAPPEVWKRGKMLGGSSSINGMVWIRGQPEDYDRYAELGINGWSWKELLPYFKKTENHELGEDEFRGSGGPIAVTTKNPPTDLGEAVIAAGVALHLPRKIDQNRPEQEGIGYLQMNIDKRGRRVSAARGFLRGARKRPNLTVVTGTRIDRVIFDGKRATGVTGVAGGQPVTYHTRGEIILSAGGITSPAILQRSGVGPADHLTRLGIPLVYDSPGVGRNLREHWLLGVQFRLKNQADTLNRAFDGIRLYANVFRYFFFGKGPMASGPCEVGGFIRTQPGLNRPDAQIMFSPYSYDESGGAGFEREPGMHIFAYALRPESTGTLDITSKDPTAPLRIDPNYLADENDRRTSVAMVRFIRDMAKTPPLSDMIVSETQQTINAKTDAEILEMFRRHGQAGYHACGTCSMGIGGNAVLDERLRVRGVEGLRVMDLSIIPEMISGNTNAPMMAMAWRASDLFLEDFRNAGA